jgi:hypothetical protein
MGPEGFVDALEAACFVQRPRPWRRAEADAAEGTRAGHQFVDQQPADALMAMDFRNIEVPKPAERRIARVIGIAIETAAGDEHVAVEESKNHFPDDS